ncbi:hypothetical protein R84B8_00521 [Treponema sp. R8-4-B8]
MGGLAVIAIIIVFVFIIVIPKKIRQIEFDAEGKMDPNNFIVRYKKSTLIFYIIYTIMFASTLGYVYFPFNFDNDKELQQALALSLLPLPGLIGIFLWIRFKIVVNGNQITSRAYFGRKKTFTFNDITKIEQGIKQTDAGLTEYITAYHQEEKLFTVKSACPGYNVLISCLKDKGARFVIGKKCMQCNNVYLVSDRVCPNCRSSLFQEIIQERTSQSQGYKPLFAPVSGDTWVCKKCGQVNSTNSSMCKGCGDYK